MTSIGTLFAFILVCAGVWIMRVPAARPAARLQRAGVPVVSILGIVVCGAMIYGLGWTNWLRLGRLAGDRPRCSTSPTAGSTAGCEAQDSAPRIAERPSSRGGAARQRRSRLSAPGAAASRSPC